MGKWLLRMDYNRDLYTLNTSIAHGVKVVLWFIGGPYNAREKEIAMRWHEDHLVRIGRHMQSLYGLIGQMGMPQAVYSTPTRRTAADQEKEPGLPKGTQPFPDGHWLQIKKGEVLCGFFKIPGPSEDDEEDVVYVCNHNAMAAQDVSMTLRQSTDDPRGLAMEPREGRLGETRRVGRNQLFVGCGRCRGLSHGGRAAWGLLGPPERSTVLLALAALIATLPTASNGTDRLTGARAMVQ